MKEQSEEALADFRHQAQAKPSHSEASTNTIAGRVRRDVTKQIWEEASASLDAPGCPLGDHGKSSSSRLSAGDLSFPADFFTQRRRQIIPFTYNKNSCGMLTIIARP